MLRLAPNRLPILLLPTILALVFTAGAATLTVRPDGAGDYPTIQSALDAAQHEDVILLTDGTFTGAGNRNLDPLGKAVTIRSESGDPARCILDLQGEMGRLRRGFYLRSGEDTTTVLRDLMIRNGSTEHT